MMKAMINITGGRQWYRIPVWLLMMALILGNPLAEPVVAASRTETLAAWPEELAGLLMTLPLGSQVAFRNANSKQREKDIAGAEADYIHALKVAGSDPSTQTARGVCAGMIAMVSIDRKNLEQALKYFQVMEPLLEGQPINWVFRQELYSGYAQCLMDNDQLDASLAILAKAEKLAAENKDPIGVVWFRELQGKAYIKQGEMIKAATAYRKIVDYRKETGYMEGIQLDYQYGSAAFDVVGEQFRKDGKLKAAVKAYRIALEFSEKGGLEEWIVRQKKVLEELDAETN